MMNVETLRSAVESRGGIDPRALAAFRIALGLLVLANILVLRLPGLVPFYTDRGVLPRSLLAEEFPALAAFSLHALSGSLWAQVVLLTLTCLFAVSLLIGYRTTLSAGVCALLLASLYARDPYVLNGGDSILLTFLIFALFLPLDQRWSVGARQTTKESSLVCSLATALFLIHFVTIYAVNAVLKYQSDAWMSGTAVPRVFHVDEYIVLLGPHLSEYTVLLTAVNWSWVLLLSAAPLLLVFTGWPRGVLAVAFISAQLGMALTMRLGVFPGVMISALLVFLPPQVWDRIESAVRTSGIIAGIRMRTPGVPRPSPCVVGRFSRLRRGLRVVGIVVLVFAFTTMFLWQIAGTGLVEPPGETLDDELANAGWSFFAPHPPSTSEWVIVEADRGADTEWLTVNGRDVAADRPPNAAEAYPTTLWNRYGTDLQIAGDAQYNALAQYVCANADENVESVTIYSVSQDVSTGGPISEPTRSERYTSTC